MGNKQTTSPERENHSNGVDGDEGERHVRFKVYQERESGLFRSFRTRPFKRHNQEKRRSATYLGTASKTAWPHPQSDSLFLPEYEYKSAVKFNDFQVNILTFLLSDYSYSLFCFALQVLKTGGSLGSPSHTIND